MPLRCYRLIRRGARLSEADAKTICDWSRLKTERLKAAATGVSLPYCAPRHGSTLRTTRKMTARASIGAQAAEMKMGK